MATRSLVLTAALASLIALPLGATSASAAEVTLSQHCEDLAKEFKELKPTHVSATKMNAAKEQAEHGEKMCKSDPKAGIKALDLAFKDIGVTPK